MAVRVRVVAIRQTNAEEVRNAFVQSLGDAWAQLALTEHNGWTSFRVSVWTTSGQDVMGTLSEFQRPSLLITSEDGSRWYASLIRPGHEPEHLVHDFGNHAGALNENYWSVDDDDDDPDEQENAFLEERPTDKPTTAFEKFAFDLRDTYGYPLPKELIEAHRGQPFDDAIDGFRRWQQDRLISFLKEFQVDSDLDQVRRILAWQGLAKTETESDLGNLPRLLATIGLGGEWDQYMQELQLQDESCSDEKDEEEEDDDVEFDRDTRPTVFSTMESMMKGIAPLEVEGGPVELPMPRFRLVEFFVNAACGGHEVAATMSYQLPKSETELAKKILSKIRPDSDIESEALPNGFKIGFENHQYIERSYLKEEFGKRVVKLISGPPDGTTFEFAFASQDEAGTQQVYRGIVKDSIWHIDATYPSLSASVLRGARTRLDGPQARTVCARSGRSGRRSFNIGERRSASV